MGLRNSIMAFLAMGILSLVPFAANAAPSAKVNFDVEVGALKILSHTYRVGSTADGNADFNFVTQGGQEILFPFNRLSACVLLEGGHDLSFLYQPLDLVTESDFRSPVTIDGKVFSGPTRVEYSFPFYRLTYQYRFIDGGQSRLAAGPAVQLRDASIRFESLDGTTLAVSQNLGVVPALAISGRIGLGESWFGEFEATGIYASSAIINGAAFSFEGSLLDASARVGLEMSPNADIFLNVRFLGGSAAGKSGYARTEWTNSASNETENRLATMSFTIGARVR